MRLITTFVSAASLLFIQAANSQPATAPTTAPAAYIPADGELKAAFDALTAMRALAVDAPIDSINALQIRPAKWTEARVREDLGSGEKMKIEIVDGHLGDGVVTFILRINPDQGGSQFGVSRLVKSDAKWKALLQPASRYRDGELSPEQLKALEAQITWIEQRMAELRGK